MPEKKREKTGSAELEATLASFGALSAVSRIRRCYPEAEKRFEQHHDIDLVRYANK
jgi:hypothetical protein